MKERYRNVDAKATVFRVICPYKECGHAQAFDEIVKEQIVKCPNCRKESKIKRII